MKHLLVLFVIATASSASAAPFALDYRAADPSCIDGARFSDEVSAKLGFVPWDSVANAKIRVRVERDGEGFSGTFRNADGSAKIIEGKTCADVTASLVLTVATAVDSTPRAAPRPVVQVQQQPAPAPAVHLGDGMIPVTFRAVDGRRLSISVQKASAIAVSTNGTAAAAAYFDNLCTSPCTAGVAQGRSYLSFADPDTSSFGGGQYLIDRPTTITLAPKSRHDVRLGLLIGGAAATGIGVLALSEGSGTGPVVGGSLLLSVGIAALVATLWVHDTFTTTQTP